MWSKHGSPTATSKEDLDMARSISLPHLFSTLPHWNFIFVIQIIASIFHGNCLRSPIYVQIGTLKLFLWDEVKLKIIKHWSISKACLSLDSKYLPLPGQSGKDKVLGRVKYSGVWRNIHIITEIYFGYCAAFLLSCPNLSGYRVFASAAVNFSTNQCTNWWAWNPDLARESHERFGVAFSANITHILIINTDICLYDILLYTIIYDTILIYRVF